MAQFLPVVAGQNHVRLLVHFHFDAVRQQVLDRVRIAEREGRDLALDVHSVTGSDHIQFAREAGRNALHCVRGQRARQTMHGGITIVLAHQFERVALLLNA